MDYLIKDVDKAIIAGGGIIHYKFHDFYAGICSFILACQRKKIPLFINAVGIEGFDKDNPKCKMFAKYLKSKTIKYITTRDDIDTLKNCYLSNRSIIPIDKVVDPAIFCSKIYPLQTSSRDIIGIGLIRDTIFDDFKVNASSELLHNYYSSLVIELEKRGLKYEFFTNGYEKDLSTLRGIEKILNKSFEVRVPHNFQDLLSIISSYRGIITARMHSCIVAYSYNIPAIAFNWNDKLKMWFNTINKADCCFKLNELNAVDVVDRFLKLEQDGYDNKLRENLENKYLNYIHSAIKLTDI